MKILLINHAPLTGSGSGVYNANIANSLIRKGHEVRIIVPDNIPVTEENVHPVYFTDKEQLPNALPFNFPCFTTHPRSVNTFQALTLEEYTLYKKTFKQTIQEEIDNFNPDVIHASHIWTLAEIASEFDIPLVVTAHGTDLFGYNEWERFRKEAIKAAFDAYKIITISEDNSKLVAETFPFANDKIELIKNGYDPEVFYKENYDKDEFLKEIGIDKHYDKVVSFAGKFTHFKGIDLLLKAAKEYEREDTITILCGNGELFNEMKELAKNLNLNNVVFLGNQPHTVLRKLYNIADVSLVPSRNEAFGLVVIEAMASGTPVVGTNQGGIPEIITDETGLLFEPENYHELAEKVSSVLDGKRKFNSDYIANYAYNTYSEDELIKPLIKIYEEAINEKKLLKK